MCDPRGVFIVIFVGIALACVTLAFEYWWYKYRNPQLNEFAANKQNIEEFNRKMKIAAITDYENVRNRHYQSNFTKKSSLPPVSDQWLQ
ncbi:ionotropic receptor 25a-like [Diaphorina citri]|uniref:Ionotropic receptor 25a-like n=1 Tax=Diaphorina citri TaxID=121845 RepID=A0A3Q0IJ48_DIACI|nr:ionotropic receptor 25a-like [Diaphorina citri]